MRHEDVGKARVVRELTGMKFGVRPGKMKRGSGTVRGPTSQLGDKTSGAGGPSMSPPNLTQAAVEAGPSNGGAPEEDVAASVPLAPLIEVLAGGEEDVVLNEHGAGVAGREIGLVLSRLSASEALVVLQGGLSSEAGDHSGPQVPKRHHRAEEAGRGGEVKGSEAFTTKRAYVLGQKRVDFKNHGVGDEKEFDEVGEEGDKVNITCDNAMLVREGFKNGGVGGKAALKLIHRRPVDVFSGDTPAHEDA